MPAASSAQSMPYIRISGSFLKSLRSKHGLREVSRLLHLAGLSTGYSWSKVARYTGRSDCSQQSAHLSLPSPAMLLVLWGVPGFKSA